MSIGPKSYFIIDEILSVPFKDALSDERGDSSYSVNPDITIHCLIVTEAL